MPNIFQIPGMKDDNVEIFESGAMLLYVADKYGGVNTPEERADASKWVLWANAALAPALFTADIEVNDCSVDIAIRSAINPNQWWQGV